MIIIRKILLALLVVISCSIHVVAQTDYYYYKGKKIPLILNEDKVCVSIPKAYEKASERLLANLQVPIMINDEAFDIFVIARSDYEKLTLLDFWEEYSKTVIITSGYYTENNEEVFATPYLNLRLKKEQDTDLMTSYVEKYKLRIVNNSTLMPLWYILAITQNSEKNTLECANELFESGYFAESLPDLASGNRLTPTTIHSITKSKTNAFSETYGIHGRRIQGCPQKKGIYVKNRKKYVMK